MKKYFALFLSLTLFLGAAACNTAPAETTSDSSRSVTETSATETTAEATESTEAKYMRYAKMTPEEIVADLTLEQKAAQMVQPSKYNIPSDILMKTNCYGSLYAEAGAVSMEDWRKYLDGFMDASIKSEAGIPFIVAQDHAHGVGYTLNSVYFPHNIGQGAANDEELEYQMGLITAEESKLCHIPWNLYPCVAQSEDPRWGRTYESYGSDLDTITRLSTAYTKGLIDGGVIACAKHFFGDGNVEYGTGEKTPLDRGNSELTENEINELIKVYQAQIDAGVQTIMVSFSALNGKQMHEYGEYIMKLKNEMGFEGFIISDYEGSQRTSPATYEEQIILGVNSGIDMFMEVTRFDEAMQSIVNGVKDGRITEERLNDAVTRIIKVKKEAGLFDDPFFENIETKQSDVGSAEYRAVAEKLVEESLVLLKNDKKTLPLKEGTKVYITGPAADNAQSQCGGWTIDWVESPSKVIAGVTTIQKAFETYAADYGIEVITDPADAKKADVVLLCVGEKSYAEWYGDTEDLELCGALGIPENREAIDEVKKLGKPTVTCILAGRQVILDKNDYKNWDSVVMCYLPGSEGKGISDVLCGCADFKGKLPSPWYGSVDQIGTDGCFLEKGYGLTYGEGFVPRTEPVAVYNDDITNPDKDRTAVEYPGNIENGVYTNSTSGLKITLPDGYHTKDNSTSVSSNRDMLKSRFASVGYFDELFLGDNDDMLLYFLDLDLCDVADSSPEGCVIFIVDFLGGQIEITQTDKVTLCGKEYTRILTNVTAQGQTCKVYFYVAKIGDHVFSCIQIDINTGEKAPEDFESWFDTGSAADDSSNKSNNGSAAAIVTSSAFTKTESGADGIVTVYDEKLAEDLCDAIMSGINWQTSYEPECPDEFDDYYQVMMCLPEYSGYSFKVMEYKGQGYMYLSQDQDGSVLPKDKLILLMDAPFQRFKELIGKIKQ